jgi:DNA-binding Lrp family transcriptional regulator
MNTKPQDVLVALKLSLEEQRLSYADLGIALGLSASEAHASVRRLIEARLVDPDTRQVRREALRNFLVHGVPYVFPASLGSITRGTPTAWAAPVMAGIINSSEQIPPVWPDAEGSVQGASVQPLYPSVPAVARKDPELYNLLALVDAIRIGRARERNYATEEISQILNAHVAA